MEIERLYWATSPGTFSPLDLRISILKPLGGEWLVSAYHYLQSNGSLTRNGFQAAGITDIIEL